MAAPKCVLVFHRHRESSESGGQVSPFSAQILGPLLEDAVNSGKKVRIIHERIHTSGHESLVDGLESIIGNREFLHGLKEVDRQARERAKRDFQKADEGLSSTEINDNGSPEDKLILVFNRAHPGTAINYINFYPLEALIETWRAMVHIARAKRAGKARDSEGVVSERIKANFAFREAFLLRDKDLARQCRELRRVNPEDTIFTSRGSNHLYMVEKFIDKGLLPVVHVAEDVPSFGDEAIWALLTTGLSNPMHERLVLLDLLFNTSLEALGDRHDPEKRKLARTMALEKYKGLGGQI
jgi:hypothetical protein